METENTFNLATPEGDPLVALDAARQAVAHWQSVMRDQLGVLHHQLQKSQSEIDRLENENALLQKGTDATVAALSAAQLEAANTQNELQDLRTVAAATVAQLHDAREEIASTREQRNAAQTSLAAALVENQTVRADAEAAHQDFDVAQRDLENLRGEFSALEIELASTRNARDESQNALGESQNELAAARGELQKSQNDLTQIRADFASTRNALASERERAESEKKDAARHAENAQRVEEENAAHRARADDACARLERSEQRRRELQKELLEVYADLRADDLPSLILRVAMKLTGAENGLFADADGTRAMASIGLDDLPKSIAESLFDFTREAAQMEEPLVKNNSEELPDHESLVNLAALPVAVQGDLRGVILVANKRDDVFTEEDTELLLSIGRHAGVAMENHRLHAELAHAYVSTIAVLADAIEAKDPYTRGHCESVARLAVEMARRMEMSAEQIEQVRYAALLHDIGKIGVPDGILLKPGRLLPEEYAIIQKHSAIGRDLVSRVPSLEKIAPIILHHHERIDGSGYPDNLAGENIPLEARIIGVIDAFDAMTTPRPYRDPVSPREALQELERCTGSQFDAELVELASQIVGEREAGMRDLASTSDVPGAPDGKRPDA